MKQMYDIVLPFDKLCYTSMMVAIPKLWKQNLRNWNNTIETKGRVKSVETNPSPSKHFYLKYLNEKILSKNSNCLLWAQELQIDINTLQN